MATKTLSEQPGQHGSSSVETAATSSLNLLGTIDYPEKRLSTASGHHLSTGSEVDS